MSDQQTNKDKLIPWYFVSFFIFLTILYSCFVVISTSTHTGVVTKNAYKKGLNYNQTILQLEKQQKLGWDSHIEYITPYLSFSLKDIDARPIENAKVTAYMFRATQEKDDFSVSLIDKGNGKYNKNIIFPLKGKWDIKIAVTWKQKYYQTSKQVIIK